MENRRNVYYKKNTVNKSKHKCNVSVFDIGKEKFRKVEITVKRTKKTFATSECMWCGKKFDGYRISCPYCNNCQYCGYFVQDVNRCLLCGNKAPEELKIKKKRIVV